MRKSFDSLAKNSRRALVVGIGGGGDILGAIPTSRYLRWLGIPTILGGLTWERYVNDPEPGPRKMEEIIDIELLSPTVGLANEKTRTNKGIRFTESIVAEVLQERIVLIDLNRGVKGTIDGLNEAMRKLEVDLFVGIDVGGDVLGDGLEKGLHSMLADSMMLSTMANLEVPTVLGVLGCCMDGELTFDEFNWQLAKIAAHRGLIGGRCLTPEDIEILEKIIPRTKTEASLLAVRAAQGLTGEVEIRGGRCKVQVTPMSALTFYLDTRTVFEHISRVAKALVPTTSLDEANEILKQANLPSELEFERSFAWKRYVKE